MTSIQADFEWNAVINEIFVFSYGLWSYILKATYRLLSLQEHI